MTYEEALLAKNNHENPYRHNGELYTIYIIPKIQKEYINFLSDLRKGKSFNDENIKAYSSNQEFTIIGLMIGANNVKEVNL